METIDSWKKLKKAFRELNIENVSSNDSYLSSYQEDNSLTYKEALTSLGVSYGLLTEKQKKVFLNDGSPKEQVESKNVVRHKVIKSERSCPSLKEGKKRDAVYKEFMNLATLSDEHREYLKSERKLSDTDIEKFRFFTLDSSFPVSKLESRVGKDALLDTPGFYEQVERVEVNGKIEEYRETKMSAVKGIGFPLKHRNDYIVALYVRVFDNPKHKYQWFSTSSMTDTFDTNDTGSFRCNGKSAGSPVGLLWNAKGADDWNNGTLFITEGYFKAIALTKVSDSPVVSMNGVSNFRKLRKLLDYVESRSKQAITNVVIVYDGDVSYNPHVMKSILSMSNSELNDYKVEVMVWDYRLGKGFDDVYLNGNLDKTTLLELEQFRHIKSEVDEEVALPKQYITGEVDDILEEREQMFYAMVDKMRKD